MTREELKKHCQKQIEGCEMWANYKCEEPSGKIYEEHKLILELLEQESKTGHWIFVDKAHVHAHCSECDYGDVDLMDGRPHNYCPNCGAKMIEPQERGKE